MIIASSHDFEKAAKRRIPRFLFDYAEGGAYDEVTLGRNVSDLAAIALRQRVLKDVANVDLSTTLFGREVALPVALGPVGISGMYARRGEVQAARALVNPASGHDRGVFAKGGGLVHIALFEANAVAVFEVNCRN